jgi:hypothetical protein
MRAELAPRRATFRPFSAPSRGEFIYSRRVPVCQVSTNQHDDGRVSTELAQPPLSVADAARAQAEAYARLRLQQAAYSRLRRGAAPDKHHTGTVRIGTGDTRMDRCVRRRVRS